MTIEMGTAHMIKNVVHNSVYWEKLSSKFYNHEAHIQVVAC